jgi:hypothetical protein
MAKVNYRFIKQRKEAARKTRQQEKQDRRAVKATERSDETPESATTDAQPATQNEAVS